IVSRLKITERYHSSKCYLLAVTIQINNRRLAVFLYSHHLFAALGDYVLCVYFRLQVHLVYLDVVGLEIDSEGLALLEVLRYVRADFVRTEDELSCGNLAVERLYEVGNDQGARLEFF